MGNYLTEILKRNQDELEIHFAVIDIIDEKFYSRGFEDLSEEEKVVFCVDKLEREINNGGFDQFFLNSSEMFNPSVKFTLKTLASLKKIDANYTYSLLEAAIKIVNDPNPIGRKEYEDDDYTDIQIEKLNDLDEKFYEYEDNLLELQINYLKNNEEKFKL
jgi:hypothetical protein